MRIKELMVGNTVLDNNGIAKDVEEIFSDSVRAGGIIYPIETISGIPLTREILDANGFDTDEMYAYYNISNTSYIIYYYHEGTLREFYKHKDGSRELIFKSKPGYRYVHELQNLFNLCGFEIELKVN